MQPSPCSRRTTRAASETPPRCGRPGDALLLHVGGDGLGLNCNAIRLLSNSKVVGNTRWDEASKLQKYRQRRRE